MGKGFYLLYEEIDEIGFSFNAVWIPQERDFQVSMLLGSIVIGFGCSF